MTPPLWRVGCVRRVRDEPVVLKVVGPVMVMPPDPTVTPGLPVRSVMPKVVPSVAVEESRLSACTPPITPSNVTLPAVLIVSERAVASRLSTVESKVMFWELVSLSVVSALSNTPSV